MLAARYLGLDRRDLDVVEVLFTRALRTRYRGSVLGVVWSALNPLGMAIVYAAIFGHTFAPYYGGSLLAYGAAVYIGLIFVATFVAGTSQALPSIVQNAGLLNKMRVPFVAFPLATLAAYGFQQLVGTLPVVIAVALYVNHSVLSLLLLIVPLAAIAMLTTGVALCLCTLNVFFRDVPYLYELLTFLFWIATPVFYPAAIVPPPLAHVLAYNPLYEIVESVRTLVLTNALPSAAMLGLSVLEGALVLGLGMLAFNRMRPHFMDML